jgi:hypothetical protein
MAITERRLDSEARIGHNGRGLVALRAEILHNVDSMRAEWTAAMASLPPALGSSVVCLGGFIEWLLEEFFDIAGDVVHPPARAVPLPRTPTIEGSLNDFLLVFPDLQRDGANAPVLSGYPDCLEARPLECGLEGADQEMSVISGGKLLKSEGVPEWTLEWLKQMDCINEDSAGSIRLEYRFAEAFIRRP